MAEVLVAKKMRPEISEMYAIMTTGRKVLIQVPETAPAWRRRRAEYNIKRWNEGKRTWLL